MDGMLTLREVMDYLELGQAEVEGLVKRRKISAYKIGGTFLRFRKDQVIGLKTSSKYGAGQAHGIAAKARDYWYFNRIYLLSAVLLILIFYLLTR